MTLHERAYRVLLRTYPASFRAAYGEEMARLFLEQLRDARDGAHSRAVIGLWVRTLIDVAATAPSQHLSREHQVAAPIEAGVPPMVTTQGTRGRTGPIVLLGLLPMWVLGFLSVAAPDFTDPLFANPPAIAGLPGGVVGLVIAMVWMLLGLALLRESTSDLVRVAVFVVFTVPATAFVLLGPALVLLMQSLE